MGPKIIPISCKPADSHAVHCSSSSHQRHIYLQGLMRERVVVLDNGASTIKAGIVDEHVGLAPRCALLSFLLWPLGRYNTIESFQTQLFVRKGTKWHTLAMKPKNARTTHRCIIGYHLRRFLFLLAPCEAIVPHGTEGVSCGLGCAKGGVGRDILGWSIRGRRIQLWENGLRTLTLFKNRWTHPKHLFW